MVFVIEHCSFAPKSHNYLTTHSLCKVVVNVLFYGNNDPTKSVSVFLQGLNVFRTE